MYLLNLKRKQTKTRKQTNSAIALLKTTATASKIKKGRKESITIQRKYTIDSICNTVTLGICYLKKL